MTSVKICGITKIEDARYAAYLGYDAIGLIFYPKSPRYITPEKARHIVSELPPFVNCIGVFVDERPEIVREIASFVKLSGLQLHGHESPEYCKSMPLRVIKAFGVDSRFNFRALAEYNDANLAGFLLDKYSPELIGGTGQTFEWGLVENAKEYGKVILAGGINLFNVEAAIKEAEPDAIDVNSGVEVLPGEKNRVKMKELIEKVRRLKN
ncbi:MAG: hypothetical protein A2293_16555 [Elusimicrobia bacterium RIFOXYB2_FULL_49_7]|nr:MAG: hypothetical protein A2293_16555 [Elusimicrobia bacterium RIFOXYB2_FULL_49_7]